jgi:serine acetyltransferase
VIVNTQATIDHDCVIGDGVHVCPGSILCGSVKVGEGAWIGAGATVIEQKQIGPYSVIGAGGVVVADIPKSALAIGVPARVSKRFTVPSA